MKSFYEINKQAILQNMVLFKILEKREEVKLEELKEFSVKWFSKVVAVLTVL